LNSYVCGVHVHEKENPSETYGGNNVDDYGHDDNNNTNNNSILHYLYATRPITSTAHCRYC
jgi:hypothetical protein